MSSFFTYHDHILGLSNKVWFSCHKDMGACTNHVDKQGGVAQMTTTLNNTYLVKCPHRGRGSKIAQNSVHVVCTRPHIKNISKQGTKLLF